MNEQPQTFANVFYQYATNPASAAVMSVFFLGMAVLNKVLHSYMVHKPEAHPMITPLTTETAEWMITASAMAAAGIIMLCIVHHVRKHRRQRKQQ